jgi:hypothetical protein
LQIFTYQPKGGFEMTFRISGSRLIVGLGALVLLLAIFPSNSNPIAQEVSQTKEQGTQTNTVRWEQEKISIASHDSRFALELPDIAPDDDWIVGVQSVADSAQESISVGQVLWRSLSEKEVGASGKIVPNIKVISEITTPATQSTTLSPGRVRLSGLAAAKGSLIIHLKVVSGTKVHIYRGGKEFVSPSAETSFMVYKGEVVAKQVKGGHSIIGYLMRSQLLGIQTGQRREQQ